MKIKKLLLIIILLTSFFYAGFFNGKAEASLELNSYIIELEKEPLVESNNFFFLQKDKEELFKEQQEVKGKINQLLNKEVGTLSNFSKEFTYLYNGLVIENISEKQAEEIKKIKGVKKVWKNQKVEILINESVPLIQGGIEAGQLGDDGNECTDNCLTGEGIKIAIIDTGVDYTHSDLGGCLGIGCKVIGGWDFVTCEEILSGGTCAPGQSKSEDDDPMDQHNHGTHVASTAAGNGTLKGVAPEAEILAYRVLNQYGQGLWSWVISGIEEAVQDGANVLNLSLGGLGEHDDPVSTAVNNAVTNGAVVVVSAGNSGPDDETIMSPGKAENAITVGATDKDDNLASFSSRGPVTEEIMKPDIVAPGVSIRAALIGDGNFGYGSGTSMAAPHVTGAVALLLEKNLQWTPEEIKNILKDGSIDLALEEKEQGEGRVDIQRTLKFQQDYSLSINTEGEGSVVKNPEQDSYTFEDEVTLTAIAEENWQFLEWSGDLQSIENPIIISIDNNKEITANFEQENYNLNISTEGEGSASKDPNKNSYAAEEEITLTINPEDGWEFSGWTGDTEHISSNVVTMPSKDVNLTANFEQIEYTITFSVEGEGTVTEEPSQPYYYNDEVTLVASPQEDWVFSHWSEDLSGSENPKTITINDNKEVTANFEKEVKEQAAVYYELNLAVLPLNSGTASGEGYYEKNEEVEIEAISEEGYNFVEWTGDTEYVDDSSSLSALVTIPSKDIDLTANFELKEYTLSIDTDGNGSVAKDPDQESYSHGTEVTLEAQAASGYTFDNWTGDLESSDNPVTIQMDSNKEITASFQRVRSGGGGGGGSSTPTYTISLTVNNENMGMVQGYGSYQQGREVTIEAIPFVDYYFSHWRENDKIASEEKKYTFVIEKNRNLEAVFFEEGEGLVEITAKEPKKDQILTDFQISSIINLLTVFNVDAETILKIESILKGEKVEITLKKTVCNFTRNLTVGSRGEDVKCLQELLNDQGFLINQTGPGSPGQETNYFGFLTQKALANFQVANNISPSLGYFGPSTREFINNL